MFHCIRFADLVISKAVTKRHFRPKRSFRMTLADQEMNLLPPSSLLGKQVIVIAGATSVGKSAVAAQLCKTLNAEIVIADCVQVTHNKVLLYHHSTFITLSNLASVSSFIVTDAF